MALFSRLDTRGLRLDPSVRVIKAAHYQAFVDSNGIIGEARALARDIERDARVAHKQSRKQGYDAGLSRADRRTAERHVESVEQAVTWIGNLEGRLARILTYAVGRVVEGLDLNDLTLRIIQKALRDYRNLPAITLRICPSQRTEISEALDGLYRETRQLQAIRLVSDSRLRPGDCVMESPLGTVDLGLTEQLRVLTRVLGAPGQVSSGEGVPEEEVASAGDARKKESSRIPASPETGR